MQDFCCLARCNTEGGLLKTVREKVDSNVQILSVRCLDGLAMVCASNWDASGARQASRGHYPEPDSYAIYCSVPLVLDTYYPWPITLCLLPLVSYTVLKDPQSYVNPAVSLSQSASSMSIFVIAMTRQWHYVAAPWSTPAVSMWSAMLAS